MNSADLSVGVSTGTHPPFSPTLTGSTIYYREPPHSTKHRQLPSNQVWSISFIEFNYYLLFQGVNDFTIWFICSQGPKVFVYLRRLCFLWMVI